MADDELSQLLAALNAEGESGQRMRQILNELASKKADERERSRSPERVELLRELYELYTSESDFTIGDLVVWKDGLKNRTVPEYGVPAIVMEVLDPPYVDTDKGAGSSYFRETVDVKLGFVDDDDELVTFHYDSKRFRHVE